jgi:uncharacterized protein (DUF2062 family)
MAEPQAADVSRKRKTGSGWLHPRTLLRYVLSQDDTPHHIALGASIGMFVGLTPTPGVQMLLVLAIYYVCRPVFTFNRPAGLAAVYVSNPLTAVPLAWLSYQVGRLFVGGDLTRAELEALLVHDGVGWWEAFTHLVVDLGWAYLIGSLVVAAAGGLLTYPVMRYLLHLVQSTPQSAEPSVAAPRTVVGAARPGERD